ncbi:MAG: hypothetical protein QM504_16040, partial [Pseudomonadota bacterium]
AEFTPVYDPTPMRAYSIHDMLSVMPFGDYGQLLNDTDEPVNLAQAIQRLARHLNITAGQTQEIIHSSLQVTQDYADKVAALKTLPERNKNNLIKIVNNVREKISLIK